MKFCDDDYREAIYRAYLNWSDWKDEFEASSWAKLPMLGNQNRFKKFLSEYSLARNIRNDSNDSPTKGKERPAQKRVREALRILKIVEPSDVKESAEGIAKLASSKEVKKRSQLSLISKVACFAYPDRFPMWDQFARRGLTRVVDGPECKKDKFIRTENYCEFAIDFDAEFENHKKCIQTRIREYTGIPGSDIKHFINSAGFQRRVFDVLLMNLGRG